MLAGPPPELQALFDRAEAGDEEAAKEADAIMQANIQAAMADRSKRRRPHRGSQ